MLVLVNVNVSVNLLDKQILCYTNLTDDVVQVFLIWYNLKLFRQKYVKFNSISEEVEYQFKPRIKVDYDKLSKTDN